MTANVHAAIRELSEISTKDLDDCSVEELAQLQYWLNKHQGAIFVKTIGRLADERRALKSEKTNET
jgi:hypothetical protein